MREYPERVLRRVVPDPVQVQVILGSLLGDGRLEGSEGDRRLRIAHHQDRAEYVWWKYERLGAFAAHSPLLRGDLLEFHTIAHPVFDDLAPLFNGHDRKRVRRAARATRARGVDDGRRPTSAQGRGVPADAARCRAGRELSRGKARVRRRRVARDALARR